LQSFIGVANGSTIGADNVSATFSTPAKPKVPQGGDCMRLGNCGCGLARTRSMRVDAPLRHLWGQAVNFGPHRCPLYPQKRTLILNL
jgi:hypothetical protein